MLKGQNQKPKPHKNCLFMYLGIKHAKGTWVSASTKYSDLDVHFQLDSHVCCMMFFHCQGPFHSLFPFCSGFQWGSSVYLCYKKSVAKTNTIAYKAGWSLSSHIFKKTRTP